MSIKSRKSIRHKGPIRSKRQIRDKTPVKSRKKTAIERPYRERDKVRFPKRYTVRTDFSYKSKAHEDQVAEKRPVADPREPLKVRAQRHIYRGITFEPRPLGKIHQEEIPEQKIPEQRPSIRHRQEEGSPYQYRFESSLATHVPRSLTPEEPPAPIIHPNGGLQRLGTDIGTLYRHGRRRWRETHPVEEERDTFYKTWREEIKGVPHEPWNRPIGVKESIIVEGRRYKFDCYYFKEDDAKHVCDRLIRNGVSCHIQHMNDYHVVYRGY